MRTKILSPRASSELSRDYTDNWSKHALSNSRFNE